MGQIIQLLSDGIFCSYDLMLVFQAVTLFVFT